MKITMKKYCKKDFGEYVQSAADGRYSADKRSSIRITQIRYV